MRKRAFVIIPAHATMSHIDIKEVCHAKTNSRAKKAKHHLQR